MCRSSSSNAVMYRSDTKVVVRLGEWATDKEYPLGVIEEVIGTAGVHDVEMRALALGQGFKSDFPPAVTSEAKRLGRK